MIPQQIAPERIRMKAVFDQICSDSPNWCQQPEALRETIIRRMERNCFGVVITMSILDGVDRLFTDKRFVDRYSSICSRVIANLNPNGLGESSHLIDRVLSGSIDPYKIAEYSSQELYPEASSTERHQIELRLNQKVVEKVSHAHVCYKCGKNETTYKEYQARSADEASTHSIECKNCYFVWRR